MELILRLSPKICRKQNWRETAEPQKSAKIITLVMLTVKLTRPLRRLSEH